MLYHLFYWLAKQYGREGVGYAYKSELFRATLAILAAFIVVGFIAPRIIRLLVKLKIGDVPEFDHAKRPLWAA